MTANEEAYQRAQKRAEAKVGFYVHLAIYIAVSIVLIVVNVSTANEYLWFKWPIIGWGIGVFFHALGVFVFSGKNAVTARMIEREMKREVLKNR